MEWFMFYALAVIALGVTLSRPTVQESVRAVLKAIAQRVRGK